MNDDQHLCYVAEIAKREAEASDLRARLAAAEARAARMEAALRNILRHGSADTPYNAMRATTGSDIRAALAADPSALAQAIEGVLAAPGMQCGTVPEMDVLATAAWTFDLVRDLIARVDALRRAWGRR